MDLVRGRPLALSGREVARQSELMRLPPAPPPASAPPPPPPPPPPQPPSTDEGGIGRRLLLGAAMVGGATAWWSFLNSQMPDMRKGKKGAVYLKTKGGNTVGARVDENGRTYMFDRAGNLYYDTGDKRLGFYIVTWDNKVYNVFLDKNGEEQRRYVGDIRDVRSFRVKDLGGISVDRLQRASKGRFDGTVTAFPDDNNDIPLPPNTPLYKNKNGEVQGPPELEEGIIQLQRKKKFWPFAGDKNDFGGPLQRGNG
ncbi:hypothetical protein COCSUDRAFT_61541 [Coccomyxa subellipsoidea C-169]|uniref:Uncharacterized protein n=1 Tax=Coccomyxa subellipsoidea (strain C-169) TaxID=574566 RepID=I0Z3U9_COCSC|nr:hypothetical protein COCSUDRAFT_61541 [Coccomyxa subellipsoidea C-169]EIE25318.1 hypothetical protein COCSUDRAFT_61541 [Coccomyxa subellipsoidea C-169]|eukprot:XP_005649862.1 hypothetical protein COCSUDRAFT_61541 [Coccomyxa subellipsoidea C-169]